MLFFCFLAVVGSIKKADYDAFVNLIHHSVFRYIFPWRVYQETVLILCADAGLFDFVETLVKECGASILFSKNHLKKLLSMRDFRARSQCIYSTCSAQEDSACTSYFIPGYEGWRVKHKKIA